MRITEQGAQSVIRNLYGYVVLALCVAVITLFGLYYNMNRFIENELMSANMKMQAIIEKNTDVINNLKR